MLKRPEGLYGGKEFKWLKPKKRTVIADSQSAGITN
jgi:hypothetical protein